VPRRRWGSRRHRNGSKAQRIEASVLADLVGEMGRVPGGRNDHEAATRFYRGRAHCLEKVS
jgi:hypothetical protein